MMHRFAAIAVLVALSFPLIAPAIIAQANATLPACCRKDGSHHCAMSSTGNLSGAAGLQAVRAKCPIYPAAATARSADFQAAPAPAWTFFAAVVSHPAEHAQTEARYRCSFSRSSQKRGPPPFFS